MQKKHFIVKGHETWAVPCVVDLLFLFILYAYFDCVAYFYATTSMHLLFLHPEKLRCHITPLPLHSGHHYTAVIFRWTRGDRWREMTVVPFRNNISGKIFIIFLKSYPTSIKLNPITSIGLEIWFNEFRDFNLMLGFTHCLEGSEKKTET